MRHRGFTLIELGVRAVKEQKTYLELSPMFALWSQRGNSFSGKVENMAEQLCGETHAAAVQLFEELADCRNPPLGLRNQQEREGAANLQSQRRGASAGGEVVENDLGLFLTRHQGKRQHGLLAPIQPEGSQ